MAGPTRASKATKRVEEEWTSTAPVSRKELISKLLSKIEKQLDIVKTKVTLADFIRLIQLQRELEKEEQPAEVIVTWRDISEKPSTG